MLDGVLKPLRCILHSEGKSKDLGFQLSYVDSLDVRWLGMFKEAPGPFKPDFGPIQSI